MIRIEQFQGILGKNAPVRPCTLTCCNLVLGLGLGGGGVARGLWKGSPQR